MIKQGKINIIIDGQFGSTGKGLVSSYVGWFEHVDIAVTNSSPNAGHTFYIDDKKFVTHHLPITGILHKRSTIYLCAGAIIDPEILLQELKMFDIDPERIVIHPRAAIINDEDRNFELNGFTKNIASTRMGVGSALSRKIKRESSLTMGCDSLKDVIGEIDLNFMLDQGCEVVMEIPQGFDLSINSGLSYPYCTSREVTVSSALSDSQVHPSYLGNVIACIRTFPIRVGNIVEDGNIIGYSGPFYQDSRELDWNDIGVEPEYTTCTKRVRRVATFSMIQYRRMINMLRPDYVVLNFANYLSSCELKKLLDKLPEVSHISYGPKIEDIKPILNRRKEDKDANLLALSRFRAYCENTRLQETR